MLRAPVLTTVLAGLVCVLSVARADDPIVRVEEDWELQVKIPNNDVTAPQIITAFSPEGTLAGVHATFEINHIASVDFGSGGLHLSTWCGDTHLAVSHAGNYASMFTDGEVVTWTQIMEIKDDELIFKVRNGTSSTWGNFGSPGTLRLKLDSTLEDLSGYSPSVSTAKSEVSFAGNRVQMLKIQRVRYIRESGATTTDSTERVVHQLTE